MADNKRQHWLPAAYLAGFVDADGEVCVYNRENNRYFSGAPQSLAYEGDFYTLTAPDGSRDVGVEKVLADIESAGIPLLRQLSAGVVLDDNARRIVSLYLGAQYARLPDYRVLTDAAWDKLFKAAFKQRIASVTDATRALEVVQARTGGPANTTPEDFLRFIQNEEYDLRAPKGSHVRNVLRGAIDFWPAFDRLAWSVARLPKDYTLVTSDSPLPSTIPKGVPTPPDGFVVITTPGAWTLFPLDACHVLIMQSGGRPRSTQFGRLTRSGARDFNFVLAANSHRFVFARDLPLLNALVRRADLDKWRKEPRVEIDPEADLSEILQAALRHPGDATGPRLESGG